MWFRAYNILWRFYVWFNGCMHVFMCVPTLEFFVELLGRCGRKLEGVMNGLLLVLASNTTGCKE